MGAGTKHGSVKSNFTITETFITRHLSYSNLIFRESLAALVQSQALTNTSKSLS